MVAFGGETLSVLATPGHTGGCMSYLTGDRAAVFTGDSLMIRGAGRTDFQEGDAHRLYRSVHDKLFALARRVHRLSGARLRGPPREQHRRGARLQPAARRRAQRGGLRRVHGEPRPAAPEADRRRAARRTCAAGGRPTATAPARARGVGAGAAIVRRRARGRARVAGRAPRRRAVVDVREPAEWNGELGRIPGARHLPLGELRARLGELPRDRPIVAVCRSGGRSAEASLILSRPVSRAPRT